MGAMGADRGPPAAAAGHRLRGQLVGKVVPPLWQYFARLLKKPDEPIAAPKGARMAAPEAIPPANLKFLRCQNGGPRC
jgi:hypothetical protein